MTVICTVALVMAAILHHTIASISGATVAGDETDAQALLEWKSIITRDPRRAMASWNASLPLCEWDGVVCGRRHGRVAALNLGAKGLAGPLSPAIANLTFLANLTLSNNTFRGGIPPELGRLFRLRVLDLRNNSFRGGIPPELSRCRRLTHLQLARNALTGTIPASFGALKDLQALVLHDNNLTGELPGFIGNLTALKGISLTQNALSGEILDVFTKLQDLAILALGANLFSGSIPPSLCNLSSLTVLSLAFNSLHGRLPSGLGTCFPRLQILQLTRNLFTGPIPESLSNATQLTQILLDLNRFSGQVSVDFGRMHLLRMLLLSQNNLTREMSFLNSLANCSGLQKLGLGFNQFQGSLPASIANLSLQLTHLVLGSNKLSGSIPSGFSRLQNLILLSLEQNRLTGTIPADIGRLPRLQVLTLANNSLSGRILPSLGNQSSISELYLFCNKLKGTIPPSLGNLQFLEALDLGQNYLTGAMPEELFKISTLIYLNLSQNQLIGTIPTGIGNLKALSQLYVSGNKLTGNIPDDLGDCSSLEMLYMNSNSFHGRIPPSMSSLRGLEILDLSHNNLSGQIPLYFQTFPFLQKLNLSFNDLGGEVPGAGVFRNASAVSVKGNSELCGGVLQLRLPKCGNNTRIPEKRHKKNRSWLIITISSVCSLMGLAIALATSLTWFLRRRHKESPTSILKLKGSQLPEISYRKLHKATNGFSASNLIGVGSFSSVYKGVIDEVEGGITLAIKVLNLERQGASKSFKAECEALRCIRHRNLVKVITCCASVDSQGDDFKALVYEFMPRGSLEMWLHPSEREGSEGHFEMTDNLNFLQRINIAVDVACAFDYLHHHCKKPVIHCDLKPSNVLLDIEMNGRVGDFGLVKFVKEHSQYRQSSSFGFRGTIGYAAPGIVLIHILLLLLPRCIGANAYAISIRNSNFKFIAEYGLGSEPSASGDVYSYGILLLEMMTGKKPTDSFFQGDLNLRNYVRSAIPDRVNDIADPTLYLEEGDQDETVGESYRRMRGSSDTGESRALEEEDCLISVLEIGVACSAETPQDRKDIGSVVRELDSVRAVLMGARVSGSMIEPDTVPSSDRSSFGM